MSSSFNDPSGIDNQSTSEAFSEVFNAKLSRCQLLKGASLLPLLGFSAGCAAPGGRDDSGATSFVPISASVEDRVRVPAGYTATPLYRWGDPVGSLQGMPEFRPGAGNTTDKQMLQAGMHHEGMHYFPLPFGSDSSTRGLLAINHEYTDDGGVIGS